MNNIFQRFLFPATTTATLETGYMQPAWRPWERSELTVKYPHSSLSSVQKVDGSERGLQLNARYSSGLDWKVFTSSCLPKKFQEDVTFGGITYKVSGIPDGKIQAL